MTFQGINIYTSPRRRQGFHRIGDRFSNLIDRDHFLGIDPLEDSWLSRSKPLVNVKENGNYFDVEIALAGYNKKNIEISLNGNTLTVTGKKEEEKEERNYLRKEHDTDSFERSISLEEDIDLDRIEAKYEQGILTIRLHRTDPNRPRPMKKISIK